MQNSLKINNIDPNNVVLGNLDNSKFLEVFILLPFFNDGKISWVNKRHPYEVDEKKKTTQKRLWMRKKRMIKNRFLIILKVVQTNFKPKKLCFFVL